MDSTLTEKRDVGMEGQENYFDIAGRFYFNYFFANIVK